MFRESESWVVLLDDTEGDVGGWTAEPKVDRVMVPGAFTFCWVVSVRILTLAVDSPANYHIRGARANTTRVRHRR